MEKETCKVRSCDQDAATRGFCHTHYDAWRNGNSEMEKIFGPFSYEKRPRKERKKKSRAKEKKVKSSTQPVVLSPLSLEEKLQVAARYYMSIEDFLKLTR